MRTTAVDDILSEIVRQKGRAFEEDREVTALAVGGIYLELLVSALKEKLLSWPSERHGKPDALEIWLVRRGFPGNMASLNGLRIFSLEVEVVDGDVLEVR